jgi:hypothetical protein
VAEYTSDDGLWPNARSLRETMVAVPA